MKIGDRIKTKGFLKGLEGVVTRIQEGKNATDHGTIEVRVEKITNKKFYVGMKCGDLEHFSHYDWENDIEIVKKK